jgi:hypothetical protein
MTTLVHPRFWYRCRTCRHSRASTWLTLAANLSDRCCGSCESPRITVYEIATRTAIALPRPLAPVAQLWQCCTCGGSGLDSYGDTCPHCHGNGHC